MKSTHLYILSCGDKLKIGVTNNIERRLQTLRTGNPDPIRLEYIEERYKPHLAEKYVLDQLSPYRIPGTEWFCNMTVQKIRSTLMMFHDQPSEPHF